MKKLFLIILSITTALAAHADEGMWTLHNLPDAVYQQMKGYGFTMPKTAICGSPTAISNSIVIFGGFCTGEVVSPRGLIMTNHHCGFEAIRSHSTVEHDYMLNGFIADSIGAELPNDGLYVAFTKEQRDITPILDSLNIHALSNFDQEQVIDSLTEVLTQEARKKDSTLYVEIDAFYEGNAYYATTYQRYDDVRLVFALPKSMGKFGGETDNWMWPRQTCDFSVFRVYVDPKTGGPAPYSKNNVPMGTVPDSIAPRKNTWLTISTEGYKDGDFAMVLGYPGSTERYLSSYGIQQLRDCVFDPMQQVRGVKQEVMKRHMNASEAVRIKYDSKFVQSANYWKNSIGMNKCIDSIGIVGMKEQYEKRIEAWMDSTGYLKDSLDFKKLKQLYDHRRSTMRAFTFFAETFTRRSNNELCVRMTNYYNGMPVKGPAKKPRKQYVEFDDNSDSWDRALDAEALAVLLKNYREQSEKRFLPDFYNTIDTKFGGDYQKYVDYLWDNSVIMKPSARIPLRLSRKLEKDLGIQMSMDLVSTLADIKLVNDSLRDSIDTQERYLCAAKLRMEQDLPHYSDANLTMRMTYGQVGGYRLNGYDSGYYTTARSIVDKMERADTIDDYSAEPIMKELLSNDGFGVFRDSVSNTLNLCFLTNNDITGGNSGSPVIDSKGRLIGLAFDGTWDSLSADIYFDRTLARCINVDIRYVLYMMKAWGKAHNLLRELGVETEVVKDKKGLHI